MGFLDKVKNMFTEEVDEPVKEEQIKVEQITKEEIDDSVEADVPVLNHSEKTRAIFFDDQDFATLEKPKVKETSPLIEEKYYTKKVETTEKKVFKLSPVISPVYGVLDKNYHKEDITPKRSMPKVTYYDRESITVDEVRKKAYGTLEDDLETTFMSSKTDNDEVIDSRVKRRYRDDMMFDDLMNPNHQDTSYYEDKEVENNEEKSKTLEPIALEDFLLSDDDANDQIDYKDPLDDTLTESDLFHLIDSMYDKEDE